jgi:outer membrane protein X
MNTNIVQLVKTATVVMVAIAVCGGTVSAQQKKKDVAIGANINLGTGDDLTNFGLGAKAQYNILDPLRIEASFNYYFPKKLGGFDILDDAASASWKISTWDLNMNAHYLFPLMEWLNAYPIGGVGLFHARNSYNGEVLGFESGSSENDTDLAINLGAGIEYYTAANVFINFEAKYKVINDWANRFELSAGIVYLF